LAAGSRVKEQGPRNPTQGRGETLSNRNDLYQAARLVLATVQVFRGRVRLTSGQVAWEGRTGDLLLVPNAAHALQAVEDSAILLTVNKAV
jgi:hypothetical protein